MHVTRYGPTVAPLFIGHVISGFVALLSNTQIFMSALKATNQTRPGAALALGTAGEA